MLWFNFILGLKFISLCFKLISIHYHTPKQRQNLIKFKPRIKLNHNIYVVVNFLFQLIFVFPLFWGMVMYANEFKTKEKQKLTEIKN